MVTLQVGVGTIIGLILLVLILIIILASAIRVVREYERAVIFRLGRVIGAKGPGLILLVPIVDQPRIIDLRIITFDVPRQRIVTRDNVTVEVDAVVYMRVEDPLAALLARRDELNRRIQVILDEATEPWGIKVTNVSIRDVVIPESMQRAMAKQAEAEREKRSRIIIAEGELLAAQKMADAAAAYATNPYAMRLRELQTWAEIAREKNLIIVTEGGGGLGSLVGVARGVAQESQKK